MQYVCVHMVCLRTQRTQQLASYFELELQSWTLALLLELVMGQVPDITNTPARLHVIP